MKHLIWTKNYQHFTVDVSIKLSQKFWVCFLNFLSAPVEATAYFLWFAFLQRRIQNVQTHLNTHQEYWTFQWDFFNKIQNVCDIFFTCGLIFEHPVAETQVWTTYVNIYGLTTKSTEVSLRKTVNTGRPEGFCINKWFCFCSQYLFKKVIIMIMRYFILKW